MHNKRVIGNYMVEKEKVSNTCIYPKVPSLAPGKWKVATHGYLSTTTWNAEGTFEEKSSLLSARAMRCTNLVSVTLLFFQDLDSVWFGVELRTTTKISPS